MQRTTCDTMVSHCLSVLTWESFIILGFLNRARRMDFDSNHPQSFPLFANWAWVGRVRMGFFTLWIQAPSAPNSDGAEGRGTPKDLLSFGEVTPSPSACLLMFLLSLCGLFWESITLGHNFSCSFLGELQQMEVSGRITHLLQTWRSARFRGKHQEIALQTCLLLTRNKK